RRRAGPGRRRAPKRATRARQRRVSSADRGYAPRMEEPRGEKVRLGGMALSNGVLVHGPTAWACAIRTLHGDPEVVAERERLVGPSVRSPLLRGPARLAEAFAFLPRLKRRLPDARLPFERPAVIGSTLASVLVLQRVRQSRLGESAKELLAGLISVAPALLA